MKRSLKLALLLSICLAPLTSGVAAKAQGASIWPAHPTIGETFGVQVKDWHTPPEELDSIRDAGFGYVRWGMGWQWMETDKGEYQFAKFDKFMDSIRQRGLKSVIILGGGNVLYTGTFKTDHPNEDRTKQVPLPPVTADGLAAYVKYISAIVDHYKGDDVVWEIWNEPDNARFWPPKMDGNAYAAVAEATCEAIRNVDPNAHIIGPAFSNFPSLAKDNWGAEYRSFISTLINSSAGKCMDAISVHPYQPGDGIPETVIDQYALAKQFITKSTPSDRTPLPIVDSEWGYTTASGVGHGNYPPPRVTADQQADYNIRQRFADLLSGVPLTILYELRDSHNGPSDDPEARFGLINYDGSPKTSYSYMSSFLRSISRAVIEKRLSAPSKNDYGVILRQPDNSQVLVYWSSDKSSGAQILTAPGKTPTLPVTTRPQLYVMKSDDAPAFIVQGGPH